MIDYHLHSHFSGDSMEDIEAYIERAQELGIQSIAITDHLDPFPDKTRDLFLFNKEDYFKELEEIRSRHPNFDLRIGAELGMIPSLVEENRKEMARYPFEFIIGSVHSVDYQDIGSGAFFPGRSLEEAYRLYYEAMLDCVRLYDFFHVLGHIDYMDRYVSYISKDTKPLDDTRFKDLITAILKEIIRTDRGIEYNTGGYRKDLGHGHPKAWILEKYYDLGGRILTLGSDAHLVKDLGSNFDQALEEIKKAGFKEIFSYKDGNFKGESIL